ncbi:MAG: DUF4365 domain-containing protein [Planctomycetes bacterium]|nr:DUF4365 domain-containing protein [Planctomycetota bacterium]
MTSNDLKSEFSHAYVRAVAHAAGYFVQESNRMMDADGVDAVLFARSPSGSTRGPRLELQLKATTQPITQDPFPFDLGIKNYDELRDDTAIPPRILVVVALPAERANWASATAAELVLRHCGTAATGAPCEACRRR